MSNEVAMRRMAPRPLPCVPVVEWPSRREAPTSAMPGPRSSAIISTPSSTARRRISPPPACFTRLVADFADLALVDDGHESRLAVHHGNLLPPRDGHACALPGRGFDLELAHQPL